MLSALIVEDDKGIRDFIREVLELENFRVTEANDGQVAIALLTGGAPHAFDLVITDIIMPEVDGIAVLFALKNAPQAKGLAPKVIAISGGGVYGDPDFYLDSTKILGVDQVLKKPFSADELRQVIQQIKFESVPSLPNHFDMPEKL